MLNLKLFESLKKLSFLFVRKVKCGRFETVINPVRPVSNVVLLLFYAGSTSEHNSNMTVA